MSNYTPYNDDTLKSSKLIGNVEFWQVDSIQAAYEIAIRLAGRLTRVEIINWSNGLDPVTGRPIDYQAQLFSIDPQQFLDKGSRGEFQEGGTQRCEVYRFVETGEFYVSLKGWFA